MNQVKGKNNFIICKQLVRIAKLQPQELLLSLIIRLTWLNYYDSLREIESLTLENLDSSREIRDDLALPLMLKTYERLSTLTSITPNMLYNSTYHRFAPIFTMPPHAAKFIKLSGNMLVSSLPVPYGLTQIRPQGNGQFCPFCLKDATYFSLRWAPVAVSACLSHKCLLIDRCPSCSKEISIYGIVAARCTWCHADLTKAKALSITLDDVGLQAQQIIQSWLMGEEHPKGVLVDLPSQSPAILYRVVEGLQSCTKLLKNFAWPFLHNTSTGPHEFILRYQEGRGVLSSHESYFLYTTAYSVLMDWPKGFYTFLNWYRESKVQQSKARHSRLSQGSAGSLIPGLLHDNLGELYSQWIRKHWAYSEFTFLQSAFERYIANNYWMNSSVARVKFGKQHSKAAELIEFVTIPEAAELLGVPHKTVELLLSSGQLTDCAAGEGAGRLLRKKELLYLYNVWTDQITFKSAAILLGLSEREIINLIDVGLLSVRFSMYERLTRTSVINCLEKIAKHTQYCPMNGGIEKLILLDMASVFQLLFPVGLNTVTVFLQVALGNLWAYQTRNQTLRLGELLFDASKIKKIIETVKTQKLLLNRNEAAKLLGIEEVLLIKWVKENRVTPFAVQGNTHYFTRSILQISSLIEQENVN